MNAILTGLSRAANRAAKPSWWSHAKRVLTLVFLMAVAIFLIIEARQVDWAKVRTALGATPMSTLGIAVALGLASHALFSTFDVVGRHYVRSRMPVPLVMAVNFTSYAFNLSFGTLIGGLAMRYRIYTRLGVKLGDVTRIISLSIVTNWIGHVLLAGIFLLWQPLLLRREWDLPVWSVRGVGILLVIVAGAYVGVCAVSRRREWNVHGRRIALPTAGMSLLQLFISCANWLLMCALVYVLMREHIAFGTVAVAMLVSAIAGVIMHVPAGLGVTEGVFITMAGHLAPREQLLAALLLYRFIYYLVPLAFAVLLYVSFEARAKVN